jgi:hypothetical protein
MKTYEVTLAKKGGGNTMKTTVTCWQNDIRKIAENQNPGYTVISYKQING